ncbi:MAG: hypothetical protein HQK75_14690 [Candidatus Magnetomorum sp.]|nr:hypothetical protein [Candidatus Magnetomorum sp.]
MKTMQSAIPKRIADFMALNQVTRQMTSVNQYIIRKVDQRLNQVMDYVTSRRNLVQSYQKTLQNKTISLWLDMKHISRFAVTFLFASPTVSDMGNPCDIGALCI